ncbi:unnamed protein product, partial [Rotaria socialis]
RACQTGNLNLVRNILSSTNYADINRPDPNGSTSLHTATFFVHVDAVQLCLRYSVIRH